MIKAVMFDLDGTLLPMDQDVFVNGYFKFLAKKLLPRGYEPEKLIQSIWTGTKAMVMNQGEKTNEEAFWDCFQEIYGDKVLEDKAIFEEFYRVDFQKAIEFCGFQKKAKEVVDLVKEKGYQTVLATNPIFPRIATESRMKWAGLEMEDFLFITTYEDSCHSKPNPEYYMDLVRRLGCSPEECLMVGNDVTEDMVAEKIGMKVFLLTDCLINKEKKDISVYPNGDFDALMEYIDHL